jgi:nucleoside-diphosphate-sugar epimerase
MILITGASGFIGSHLLSSIIELYGQEKILALTSKPTSKCKYLLHNDYSFDDDYFVNSGFENIEIIIHAGAFIPKSSSDGNNISECNSNVSSTAKLLTSNLPNIKNFVFFSTVDVYGYNSLISEETNLSPSSLYGHSKVYCEQMITAWAAKKKFVIKYLE